MNRLKRINSGRGHWYKLDGEYAPGVTTVLAALDKPWMKPWVAGLIADYVAAQREWLVEAPDDDAIRSVLKALPNNVRNAAMLRGTEAHTHAETLLTTGTVELDPGEQLDMVRGLAAFYETWDIEPVAVEVPCANTQHRWAGTLDLLARSAPIARHLGLPDAALGLIDLKSNAKAIYPESAIQVATYRLADIAHIDGTEQPMPRVDWLGLIRLTTHGAELTLVSMARADDLYRLFTAARHIWAATDHKRGWLNTVLGDPATTPADLELTWEPAA